MADDTDQKPDDAVMQALKDLYVATLTATEQIHRLKVRFKVRYRYCRLVELLHCCLQCGCCHNIQHDARKTGECCCCWAMCTLHRIEALGGDAESKLDPVAITDDVRVCLGIVLVTLQSVYDAANLAIKAAANDHPTAKVAGEIQCAAGHHIECVKAHIRQIDDMKGDYLLTLV